MPTEYSLRGAAPVASSNSVEERGLLRRILASPRFARAETLQRILRFLVEHTLSQGYSPKEYEIAVGALNRPDSFDPKNDAIVRVSMGNIRERLQYYFENEGKRESLRLELPKGQYLVRFVRTDQPRQFAEDDTASSSLHGFWEPYICGPRENFLLYSELLFFRDQRGNYFRNIYVNDALYDRELVRPHLPGTDHDGIVPSFHFLSCGEMHAVLSVVQAFQRMQIPLLVKNSQIVSWTEVHGSNLIVLGNSRTSSFVRQLQGEEHLHLRDDHIEERREDNKPGHIYKSSRSVCGSLQLTHEYALITRRPGPSGGCVTLIMANHACAMEGAMQFLVDPSKVSELATKFGTEHGSVLPSHFQVVLKVDIADPGEEVIDTQYIRHIVL